MPEFMGIPFCLNEDAGSTFSRHICSFWIVLDFVDTGAKILPAHFWCFCG